MPRKIVIRNVEEQLYEKVSFKEINVSKTTY